MSVYTTDLRTIDKSGYPLFNFSYPIWDENYRPVLNEKILKRYYFREIGFETVGMFKHYLEERLNSIMPKYNEMYQAKTQYLAQNPYDNKNITVTRKQKTEAKTEQSGQEQGSNVQSVSGSSNENNIGTATNRHVEQDTPTSKLGNKDYASRITDDTNTDNHATTSNQSQTVNGSTGSNVSSEGNVLTTDDYIETLKGFDGMKYSFDVWEGIREQIIIIDNLILDDLYDLFMGVY